LSNYAKEKLKKYQLERIGQKKTNKQGYLMVVIEYNNAHNVVVEFQDEYRTRVNCEWLQFKRGTIVNPTTYKHRLGQEKYNNQGYLMKVVEYNDSDNVIVEFDDTHKTRVKCKWCQFEKGSLHNPTVYADRLKEAKLNNQGCLMKIVEYNKADDIIVEFQDKYRAKVHAAYREFENGEVKNPYYPSVYGVGVTGNKYPTRIGKGNQIKEYSIWKTMLIRCYDEEYKTKHPTYKDATCCNEWLLFENFYEWLHSQENFDKWLNGERWNLDKDILIKGNKVYSPNTCCLVPPNVNNLFIKNDANRGNCPIGVCKKDDGYGSYCNNYKKREFLGYHDTEVGAFLAYKKRKEQIIKQTAQTEYDNGNITKRCYEAMMKYEVEITD
jgi:hypothetical protein